MIGLLNTNFKKIRVLVPIFAATIYKNCKCVKSLTDEPIKHLPVEDLQY